MESGLQKAKDELCVSFRFLLRNQQAVRVSCLWAKIFESAEKLRFGPSPLTLPFNFSQLSSSTSTVKSASGIKSIWSRIVCMCMRVGVYATQIANKNMPRSYSSIIFNNNILCIRSSIEASEWFGKSRIFLYSINIERGAVGWKGTVGFKCLIYGHLNCQIHKYYSSDKWN